MKVLKWNDFYWNSMCSQVFFRYKLWLKDDINRESKMVKLNGRSLSCKLGICKLIHLNKVFEQVELHKFSEYWETSPLKQWANNKTKNR